MDSAVNDFFGTVVEGKDNADVFNEAVMCEGLREAVIERLFDMEDIFTVEAWWTDKELMKMFDDAYVSECICLPKDPVERIRWIALLIVEMCNEEGCDGSDIVTPPDFLPDDVMVIFEEVFREEMARASDLHDQLQIKGWKAVFG